MRHPYRFPPELLAYDNAIEAFMEEMRRKNIHVVDAKEAEFVQAVNQMPKARPWRLKAFIAFTVMVFFWWEVFRWLGMV